jgi:protein SCO1
MTLRSTLITRITLAFRPGRVGLAALALLSLALPSLANNNYSASCIVLAVDRPHQSMRVTCREIPGFMAATVMDLPLRDVHELNDLFQGEMIDFTLVVTGKTVHAESVRVHRFQSTDPEPMADRQLVLLGQLVDSDAARVKPLTVGDGVPDFSLISQKHQQIRLSQFRGRVVGITFLYTHCPLPNYCYRLSNNFGLVQKRFAERMGRDLVLLSITFDPEHDQPEVLARYAGNWKAADVKGWYFLTGPLAEIQKASWEFGMNFWQDEGFLTHALHTIVLDRQGRMVANLEGNEFTAQQLGDLFESVLSGPSYAR